ncbi:DUF1841 family protein [Francisella frigiditurris]|uniref:DUF1841 family protein n=1 Tax=Francisella frigiditurris TaxID=1542390 RepID=A0A1J0KRX3_9GAMM|nr:DUF1841 family protein [Francisella frigiditurris]APC96372.1 hypothetical protein KX01_1479 [Francisella frigiditurris]
MIFSQDRNELRMLYISSWQKFQNKKVLTPLEEQIVRIIEKHPEYQSMLTEKNIDTDYSPESGQVNPFLHMSLHLAIIEQYQTNRPLEIRNIYNKLVEKYKDEHKVHHIMMDHLAEEIWKSQKYNTIPNEKDYVANLEKVLKE